MRKGRASSSLRNANVPQQRVSRILKFADTPCCDLPFFGDDEFPVVWFEKALARSAKPDLQLRMLGSRSGAAQLTTTARLPRPPQRAANQPL